MTLFEQRAYRCLDDQIDQVCVLVFGDFILDRYCFGTVERISPEAPVPVVRMISENCVPGGAGNVVVNIAGLGGQGIPVGLSGQDLEGACLKDFFSQQRVDCQAFFQVPSRPTSQKTRVVVGQQQMIRLDRELTVPASPEESSILRQGFSEILPFVSAVVLSDYGKGVCTSSNCTHVIQEAKKAGVPVIVDPKGVEWEKYRGATWVTPNLKELALAASLPELPNENDEVVRTGCLVRERYDIDYLLVTRSEAGMTLISKDDVVHVRSVAREVFDVSGAGDTVVAALALFLGSGFSPEESVKLANTSAGIVVGKAGTRPVLASELKDALKGANGGIPAQKKLLSLQDACQQVSEWKAEGLEVVATNGCFDILHPGHVTYLEEAARLGNRLVVLLNSDDSIRRLKGPERPVNSLESRACVLAGLASVDLICVFEDDTPREAYRQMAPDIICKGGDYSPQTVIGGEFARKVVVLPFIKGHSTTQIVQRITNTKHDHGVNKV